MPSRWSNACWRCRGGTPKGARLAIRARSANLHASDVDRGLTKDCSLIITTLNRGTLHLALRDYPWLHALTAPATGRRQRTSLEPARVSRAARAGDGADRACPRPHRAAHAQSNDERRRLNHPGDRLSDVLGAAEIRTVPPHFASVRSIRLGFGRRELGLRLEQQLPANSAVKNATVRLGCALQR